ncbi:hypothetical protein SEA_SKINNYPETE_37 [Mycobacterium phage SkinnyPete]|uniref:Uncharacterized protein n=1 Tax=Mycobacterium phage SkinnyPete TaxID=1821539 RepID=A0A142ULG5_9CAUD|nr:hypothetical protein FDG99_gp37 [Mycobacterium phage SkinnyPete]AMU78467.1 hypothetical protein SEA_SKINNYPETE_37 [Mycobacterium phage SkinnyPete]
MSAYPYEVHETAGGGMDAVVTTPDGEVLAGMATKLSLGPWTVALLDGQGGHAAATGLDESTTRDLLQFHAALLSRALTAEAVAS